MKATSSVSIATSQLGRVVYGGFLGVLLVFTPGFSAAFEGEPVKGDKAVVAGMDYCLPENPEELLRLDDEMKTYFAARIHRGDSIEARLDEVINAILGEKGLHFIYDLEGVYDVREAFRRRSGNCLTYSMLVVAVAREFGIDAQFNEVIVGPHWNRSGGIILERRHVNVRVDAIGGSFEIDLKLNDDLTASRSSAKLVDDARVISGAYNSVGVYRLAAGDYAGALRLMEQSTTIDPTYTSAWTNRGGAYLMAGQSERAWECYERALAVEPNTPAALSGQAFIHRKNGRIAEAEKLERKVLSYRERNPYYLVSVARDEIASGNLVAARRHLKRAIRIKSDDPAFFELLAEVARGQGLESEAKRWTERSKRGAS